MQQVSHSSWKIKYKQLLHIIFITNKTNMLQCKLLLSTDNINLEIKEVELEGANWIYVAQDRDQFLLVWVRKLNFWLDKTCLRNYQQH